MMLLAAHLIGDFLLQNDWMQAKSRSSRVCLVHVLFYAIPFSVLCGLGFLSLTALVLILVEHFLQDRFALHLKWMRFYGHTTAEKWPTGPLCVDQSMHVAFILLISNLLP